MQNKEQLPVALSLKRNNINVKSKSFRTQITFKEIVGDPVFGAIV